VEGANQFPRREYIAEFNRRFTTPAAQTGTALVRTRRKDLEWIFSLQPKRRVGQDNAMTLDHCVIQIEKVRWHNTLAGTAVIAHEHLDGRVSIPPGSHLIAEYPATSARFPASRLPSRRYAAHPK
jgi:hypothetical protein